MRARPSQLEDKKIPNWCDNSLSVSHSDPAMIDRFMKAVETGNLFAEFVPLNETGEWDYHAAVDMWGTKWDACDASFEKTDENSVSGYFMSAWAPPIGFYEAMVELGFDIDAHYHEPGMAFAGTFNNEEGDYSFEYDFSDPEWRDSVSSETLLDWLESEYETWLDWQEEAE